MGYTTEFKGKFNLDKPLDDETYNLLLGLAKTRRVKRDVDSDYGVEGEFYIKDDNNGIINNNQPPSSQPALWLQWIPTEDRLHIEWDGQEKFYAYTEWLKYLIEKIFKPGEYILSGEVEWNGEDRSDVGKIVIKDNIVEEKEGKISYE